MVAEVRHVERHMRWLAVLILGALSVAPALAREIDPAERREYPYDAALPACSDAGVLGNIQNRFASSEWRFWNSGAEILAFERVREVAWRPWGLDYIPRRFCSGTVLTSDGLTRRIDYSIREDLGFIGIGWGTEFCVAGFDRYYAYAPACRQARP
jgi:hypothetical protein